MNRIDGDLTIDGLLVPASIFLPVSSILDANVSSSAAIAASKMTHEHIAGYSQASGSAVVAVTQIMHIARGAGTVLGVDVAVDTAPTGGSLAYTVDVKKSTAGGAWTTILTAVTTIDNTKANRTKYAASVVGSPTFAAGDLFQVVIALAGSTGTQGLGVRVSLATSEAYG